MLDFKYADGQRDIKWLSRKVVRLKKRIRQLLRDKHEVPNSRGIIRKWTDRKQVLLDSAIMSVVVYAERLRA